MVASVVVMILSLQGRHFFGTVSSDDKLLARGNQEENCFNASNLLSVKITNSHHELFVLIHLLK